MNKFTVQDLINDQTYHEVHFEGKRIGFWWTGCNAVDERANTSFRCETLKEFRAYFEEKPVAKLSA